MIDNAFHFRKRFPGKAQQIDHFMSKDTEFAGICEDLDACVSALKYWINSKEPEAESRVSEYRAIIRELEEEILQALEHRGPPQPD